MGSGESSQKPGARVALRRFNIPERRIGKLGTGKRSPDPMSGSGNAGGSRGRNRFTLRTLLPQTSTSSVHTPASRNNMDFSQLNAAEQAQMSRILEKKQVRPFCECCLSPRFADGQTIPDARLLEDVL